MKFTDDELVILMIYAEETRGKTIESIRGMIYRTAIDETELREMGNSAIRKLEQMTDEEYETWTFTISATHCKGGQKCQGGQNILQRSHRMPQGI